MYLVSVYFKNGDSVFYHTDENIYFDGGYLVINSVFGKYIHMFDDIKCFDIDFI